LDLLTGRLCSPLPFDRGRVQRELSMTRSNVRARSRGTRFTPRRYVAITLSVDQAMPLDEDDPASGGDAAAAACMLRISSRKSSRRRRWPSLSNPSSCPPHLSCHYSNNKHCVQKPAEGAQRGLSQLSGPVSLLDTGQPTTRDRRDQGHA
jgi:hypothetical protein